MFSCSHANLGSQQTPELSIPSTRRQMASRSGPRLQSLLKSLLWASQLLNLAPPAGSAPALNENIRLFCTLFESDFQFSLTHNLRCERFLQNKEGSSEEENMISEELQEQGEFHLLNKKLPNDPDGVQVAFRTSGVHWDSPPALRPSSS
ncbi:unnamed protein product [Pleuronectes platessa]|uniref:Uncharacterized protein n=1 Tax=Pleuronectes platessa TaxID=8262 RepID=A0A9N7V2L1_PLEPL|nr:unnamed protein product [Pleuronectes platessa]